MRPRDLPDNVDAVFCAFELVPMRLKWVQTIRRKAFWQKYG
jgi:hypothetical protein